MVILLFVYAVNFNIFNELIILIFTQTKIISCRNVRLELTDFLFKIFQNSLERYALLESGCKCITFFITDKLFFEKVFSNLKS